MCAVLDPPESVRFQQESLSAIFIARLSALRKKPCPFSTGICVRFQQESLSVFSRNWCPLSPGMSVRFGQEYAHIFIIYHFPSLVGI